MTPSDTLIQNIPVYHADAFRVSVGANLGDGMSHMHDMVPDDVYVLMSDAKRERLALRTLGGGGFQISEGSEIGRAGATIHLDCTANLMSPDGQNTDVLILVEVDENHEIADIYVLPLAPLYPQTGYTLVGLDRASARKKFAQVACVSFTRGTQITLVSGVQVPIEKLKVGDKVLTRDSGGQEIRWIGRHTVRATGEFAPIVITAGTLNNTNDLVVSPDHRLFVYQRTDQIGVGRSELLVKARHLLNGDSVYTLNGGFVDYYQILFDQHHIIYAEGIAAESMLVDPRTRPALPSELLEKLGTILPGHSRNKAHGLDVQEVLLDRPDAIELLRRASMR